MSSDSPYGKLKSIKGFVDNVRALTYNDLSISKNAADTDVADEVACADFERLLELIEQAMSNNICSYCGYAFSDHEECPSKPTATSANPNTGLVENLSPEGYQSSNSSTGSLQQNTESTKDTPLWMSMAMFDINGHIVEGTTWSTPIRMNGIQGERGADGISGTVFEEIYILGNAAVKPNKPISNQIAEDLPYDSIYDRSWTRYPSGVTNDTPIEYYSKRYYDDSTGVWGEGSNPVAGSQFGREGRDGKHIEYIFCVGDEQGVVVPYSNPDKDETKLKWPLEITSSKKTYRWYDDPPSNLQPTQVIGCSIRHSEESIGESGHPVLKGGPYSTPTIGARYSVDGKEGGGRYVTAYCVAKDGYKPVKPSGGSGDVVTQKVTAPVDPNGIVTWYDHPPTRNAGEIIGMSSASFHSGGYIIGEWSDPVQLTVDGINGKDGDSIQFIYRLLHSVEDFEILKNFHALAREKGIKLESNQSSDEAPNKIDKIASSDFANFGISSFDGEQEGDYGTICKTDGTDEPQGINLTNLVECACTRTKSANGLWSDWSDPVPWSVWGKDGMDGEGVEYIFMVTPKMIEIEGEEQDFLEYYRELNAKGEVPEGLRIPTREDYEAYDQEHGTNGAEAFGKYEFCPGVSDGNIFGIQDGHDEPQDVDADQPYEWVAIRKKEIGTTDDGNQNEYIGEWGNFSSPKLGNKFASDGRSSVMAYAFTRSNKPLNELLRKINDQIDFSPKGGDGDRPIPDDTWYMDTETGVTGDYIVGSDSVPGNTDDGDIWMVSRFFSSKGDSNNDGETVDDTWSIPCKMTDRSDFQVEFVGYCEKDGVVDPDIGPKPENFDTFYNSASGANKLENAEKAWREAEKEKGWSWGDDETDPVWMATCRLKNGKWTDGHVVKVKGETGTAGTSVKIIGSAKLIKDCTLNMTDPSKVQIMPDGKIAFYVLYYCDSDGGVSAGEGVMYKGMDPNDVDIPANVETKGYYKYKDYYTLSTGDGGLIDGELGVWDGDSYENVGQIQGPPGEADRLYIAFSDDDAVTEKDSIIDINLTLTTGKYIGYYAGPAISKDVLEKSSTYNWSKGKGQDGGGQEQIFLLTKEVVSDKVTITRDQGPFVPVDNKQQHEWRPLVDSRYADYVSKIHEIASDSGEYKKGEYRWSDAPLTPNKAYPFCWVVTRNTSNGEGKGENGRAVLYSNYVESGKDAIYLELSEDSVSVPLDMSGEIDVDTEETAFDLTATLYSGRDKIENPGEISIQYQLGNSNWVDNVENSNLIRISVNQLKEYKADKDKYPSYINVKVTGDGGEGIKTCKINYGTALYELTVSKSVLHKDLSTGYLFKDYDKVNVYVKHGIRDTGLPASDTPVYCDITKLDGTHDTKQTDTDANGNAEFDSLSTIENISNVEFYLKDKYHNKICNETIGIVANGKDGAGQEFIYKLYENEVTDWSNLGPEWKNPDDNTTNDAEQKYKDPDYVPNGGSDDPLEVTYNNKYQYVSVRKRNGNDGWSPFSTPTLWSRMDVNLQVHMPSESVIICNKQQGIGLSKSRTIDFSLTTTENGNAVQPDSITLHSQKKGNEDVTCWHLTSAGLNTSYIINLKYNEDPIFEESTYVLELEVKYKNAIIYQQHTVKLISGGGENAVHVELSEDSCTVRKGTDNKYYSEDVSAAVTKADLYNGNGKVINVNWEITPNGCTTTTEKQDDGSCLISVDEVTKDNATVDITGIDNNNDYIKASKTFRIRVTRDKDVFKLVPNKPVVNFSLDATLAFEIGKNDTKESNLDAYSVKYYVGSTQKTLTKPFEIDMTGDMDGTVFELYHDGKCVDTESVGVVYNGKGASYYTISANFSTCTIKENEEITIYPIVKLVTDNRNDSETWQLNTKQAINNFSSHYIYYQTSNEPNSHTPYDQSKIPLKVNSNWEGIRFYLSPLQSSTQLNKCPMCEIPITVIKDGESGKTPVIYPAGKYDENTKYQSDSSKAPYVYTTKDNGDVTGYYIAYGSGKSDPTNESNHNTNPDWNNVPTDKLQGVPMTQYEAIYSDIGILKTALVGKWVFYKDGMFSQDGKGNDETQMSYSDVEDGANWRNEFTPNILFNAKTGVGSFGAGAITLGDGSGINTTVGGWEVTDSGLVATNNSKEIAKLGNDGSGFLGNFVDNGISYKAFSGDGADEAKIGNSIKITPDGFIASPFDNSDSKLEVGVETRGDVPYSFLEFKTSKTTGFRTSATSNTTIFYNTDSFPNSTTFLAPLVSYIDPDSIHTQGFYTNGDIHAKGLEVDTIRGSFDGIPSTGLTIPIDEGYTDRKIIGSGNIILKEGIHVGGLYMIIPTGPIHLNCAENVNLKVNGNTKIYHDLNEGEIAFVVFFDDEGRLNCFSH